MTEQSPKTEYAGGLFRPDKSGEWYQHLFFTKTKPGARPGFA